MEEGRNQVSYDDLELPRVSKNREHERSKSSRYDDDSSYSRSENESKKTKREYINISDSSSEDEDHQRSKRSRSNKYVDEEEEPNEEEEPRMIFDENTGYYFDKETLLHYDSSTNLYIDLKTEERKLYHFNHSTNSYMEVEAIQGAPVKAKKDENTSSEKKDAESQDYSFFPGEWEYDETSGNYYDKRTGLYYDSVAQLYYDYRIFPAANYHWNPEALQLQRVNPDSIYQIPKKEGPVTRFLLVLQPSGEQYFIGEPVDPSDKRVKTVTTIGRDKRNTIVLTDLESSKNHARITWENVYWKHFFWLEDLGSVNGTFLNGQRLSESRKATKEREFSIKQGDSIRIGSTTIVVCPVTDELLWEEMQRLKRERFQVVSTTQNDVAQLKKELKMSSHERKERESALEKYQDRAKIRRVIHKGFNEKKEKLPVPEELKVKPQAYGTETASLNTTIPEKNRGFKLLQQMGWSKGEGLGREKKGIVDPLSVNQMQGRKGLGWSSWATDLEKQTK